MRRAWLGATWLFIVSLGLRLLAAWVLGEGAPFGPDGTGAEAAVHLGGHLYPLHILGIRLVGGARRLSLLTGALTPVLLWILARRSGLGRAGGWIAAVFPLAIYTSALAAGDAPALFIVVLGATLATAGHRLPAVLGGALAMASLAVKPVAAPALVLLLLRPWALLGAALTLPWTAPWLRPLLHPLPDGGLLGTWWQSSGGIPPTHLLAWIGGGVDALWRTPAWAGVWLLLLALGSLQRRRLGALAPVLAALAVAALFGDRLEPRYLAAPLIAALPWAGVPLRRPPRWHLPLLAGLLLWLSAALLTQVGELRRALDPESSPPEVPVIPWPSVDARALFDEASTLRATTLRRQAIELAAVLPRGSTVRVTRRPHGREGELTWPLQVLRPDVRIERVEP